MHFRNALIAAAVVVLAGPASAQTRLTLAAGGLVPFGDLEETTDPSPRGLLRAEFQPVNALGVVSPVAFLVYLGYSDLALKSEVKDALLVAGDTTEPYLMEAGAGVRVYSRAAPFFLSGGAGYARYRPGGDAEAHNGLDLHGGLGFLLPVGIVLVEPEITGHVVLLDEGDFQFLSATLGVALPF